MVNNKDKEKLMKEVLGKKRTSFNVLDAKEYLEDLKLGGEKKETSKKINEANSVLEELNSILLQQQKDLESMVNETLGSKTLSEKDMNKLQNEIEKDFGVVVETKQFIAKDVSKEAFDNVKEKISEVMIGQNEAVEAIVNGFRRPFVMNTGDEKSQNNIIVLGKVGSGKHSLIKHVASFLSQKQIIESSEVYTIDMSLYNSSSQEQIFLQDLYVALKGKGSIICFENFEVGYPPLLRMVNDLAVNGKMILNKRYVVNKGQLSEAQTGLVSEVVNSLSAKGKYLIFISQNKLSKVVDSFGATFMQHINDIVELKEVDEDVLRKIINIKLLNLTKSVSSNLKLNLKIQEDIINNIYLTFDKDFGLDSIDEIISKYYKELSEAKLKDDIGDNIDVYLEVVDNKAVAKINEKSYGLVKEIDNGLDEINKELDEVVGLNMVKDYIKTLQSHILVQNKRKQQGLKTSDVSKHMIFTGNPGTGKTTIARLISRYMKAIGALSQGQLVEVTRADLVGKYVGHTAPLTLSVIKSAIGGVLFIDEAYSLYRGKDDSFGLEAIDTLVKAMEDYRDDLIVILAGYSKEMSVFLESNSGLKSRFPNVINFPDYTGEELFKIASVIARGKGYKFSNDIEKPLVDFFNKKQESNAKENGNGRLARNIVEEATLKQSKRLIDSGSDKIDVLELSDFNLD